MPKAATTIYLERRQLEVLKSISEESGIPMAVFVRRGLDMALREFGEKRYLNLSEKYCQLCMGTGTSIPVDESLKVQDEPPTRDQDAD